MINIEDNSIEKITTTEKIFKENIKRLRKSKPGCINKTQAAKEIGISQAYYNKLESTTTHKQPSFEVMEKIASYYNIEAHELIKLYKEDK